MSDVTRDHTDYLGTVYWLRSDEARRWAAEVGLRDRRGNGVFPSSTPPCWFESEFDAAGLAVADKVLRPSLLIPPEKPKESRYYIVTAAMFVFAIGLAMIMMIISELFCGSNLLTSFFMVNVPILIFGVEASSRCHAADSAQLSGPPPSLQEEAARRVSEED